MGVWEQKVLGRGWGRKSPKVRIWYILGTKKKSLSLLEREEEVRGNMGEVERWVGASPRTRNQISVCVQ